MTRWYEAGMPEGMQPTEAQAIEKARDYWRMRTYWNFLSPAAGRFASPYDFYTDKYREYTAQYGWQEGERLYDEEFGENYRLYKESLTKGTTGMSPDQQAYAQIQKNQPLWNRLVAVNPEFGQMITNPVARGEFSPAVYEWMQGRAIAPGSAVTFRTSQSVPDMELAANIDKGWSDYMKAAAIRDELLAQRGLADMNADGAEEIKDAWNQWLEKAKQDNTQWAMKFAERTNETPATITALTMLVDDDNFMATAPDQRMWTAVQEYLSGRETILALLQERIDEGGAKTITAKANADLTDAWEQFKARLISSDSNFAAFYDRWLEFDSLEKVYVDQGGQ
jgi:hypothetical protein